MVDTFTADRLEAVARALGDTAMGFTSSEIGRLFQECKWEDAWQGETKWKRIYNTLATVQNAKQDGIQVIGFVRKAMKPARHLHNPERFESMRHSLNLALAFSGWQVLANGDVERAIAVRTLSDAQARADELRAMLSVRGIHPDVLVFCKAELLANNHFHAVFEATKSIAQKLRDRTGCELDGGELVDRTLTGKPPMLAINTLRTENELKEQSGFVNLLKGVFGMFRNTTAHAPKVLWEMDRDDAADLFALASLIHRRIDKAIMPPRV